MAQSKTTNGADSGTEDTRNAVVGVMADAQERLAAGANQVAEKLPDALAGAQVAARDTQRALDGMSDEALIAGTSFSVGLAVGLFFGGVNRLLILLAALPGAAMAATLAGRRQAPEAGSSGRRRGATTTDTAG